MNKTIKVTKEKIAESVKRDSAHCMISESVREQIPGAKKVSTDLQTIRFTVDDTRYVFLTPRKAQEALVDFDREIVPAPFTLVLAGGQEIRANTRFGNIRAPRKQSKTDTEYAKKRRRRHKVREHLRAGKKATIQLQGPGHEHQVPTILGGKEPPRIPHGARRQFGLRGLAR